MDEAARYMEETLREPQGRAALQYIQQERGLPEEVLNAFRIGYAPSDFQALRSHLKAKGYSDQQMADAGLIKFSEKGKEPYSFFRDRVMFPVPDRRGRIVAFGGRVLPEHLRPPERDGFKAPKYINSSDSALFHKGRMLYGEPHARQAAADGQPVIVVEGYLDVIACWRAGFKGAVAPLGTALTEDQIQVLWKMCPGESKIPILCFDGDAAGQRAASRACARILPQLKPYHSAKIAFLPEGEDPDSLIKQSGAKAFEEIVSKALNLVDFLWMDATKGEDFTTPEARAGLSKSLDDLAAQIVDRAVQFYYRDAFRDKIRKAFAPAPVQTTQNYSGKWSKKPFTQLQQQPLTPLKKPKFSKDALIRKALLACVLNHPAIYGEVEEDFGLLSFSENRLDLLRQAVLSTLTLYPDLDGQGVKNHLIGQGFTAELETVLSDTVLTHAGFAKAGADDLVALNGWKEAWAALEQIAREQDFKVAQGQAYQDLTPENEERLLALRNLKVRTEL